MLKYCQYQVTWKQILHVGCSKDSLVNEIKNSSCSNFLKRFNQTKYWPFLRLSVSCRKFPEFIKFISAGHFDYLFYFKWWWILLTWHKWRSLKIRWILMSPSGHGRNQEGLDPLQKLLSRALAAVQIFSEGSRPSWVRPCIWDIQQ